MNEPTIADAIAWFEKRKAGVTMPGANAMYDMAINALRAQAETEKNDTLTLDELREMDGEPVFLVHNKYGNGWCIIDWHGVNKSWFYFSKTGTAEGMTAVPVTAADYAETWFAYRRKPEEET